MLSDDKVGILLKLELLKATEALAGVAQWIECGL